MHPKYTTTYRVGNWAEYDRALVRRGDVTLWLTPDAIATWAAAGVGRRSGPLQYSDLAIETALTLSLLWVANYYSARQSVEIIKFGDPGRGR